MPRQRKRKKAKHLDEPELDPDVWQIETNFTKGMLTGNRGVVVEVLHKPSGRKLVKSVAASTKTDARTKRLVLIQELVAKLLPR